MSLGDHRPAFYEVRVPVSKKDEENSTAMVKLFFVVVALMLFAVFITWLENIVYTWFDKAASWVGDTYAALLAYLPF
ncbi:hypothetical protein KHQ08_18250 (plasmid) [Pseudochrobactrum algeriensis]|uniref:Uncharacterized protein n=1 Tax=Pseudochrobactrum kiredjianiae TaxID=386305 RepID=A0ABW3UXK2_9HYPH|nr:MULTISPECIES: hypothetical protein [Pseudochrobactrum]MDM7852969.1 hypothetical protein [Pseudochrobactrum kiredjianiae]MDP8250930.1 hypothetical protein [Pseudochrobactrum saccharolyticum]QVQ38645.1 hypothetical protein KHQ08_18250 [Pseudochrobactrum algeriensis]QVQ42209.1 hypothetical protein KHQ07_18210 [Pseudochrobactrum algeriensis]QVQ45789.1 hypothetical protein KHQ09_18150 [Pseudochrobactrum algeriensis]